MKPFPALVRTGLRANFGLRAIAYRFFTEKKDRWLLPLFALAAVSLAPTLYAGIKLLAGLYGMLTPMNQQAAILTFALLTGQVLILLFGLYYVISAFYFSRDLEILIPLPLKPFQVMLSKFIVICVNEYVTVFLLVAPVLITWGIKAGRGPDYWIAAVLVYLLLPVIPLAVVSLLVVALMRLVNVSRKKDALILIGSLILIAGSIALQSVVGRANESGLSAQSAVAFFSAPDSLLNRVGAFFPPSIWATKALAGGPGATGIAHLALFAGVSLALFLALIVLSEKLFYRGLVGIGETSARRRTLSPAEMSRRVSSGRRPFRALLAREWRIMNRTPIFLLNGVLVVVIIPVVMILMVKTGGDTEVFLVKFLGAANPAVVVLGAAAFLTVSGSLNGTASSTFSREGGQFWMSKVIPVAPRDLVAAKLVHSYAISVLGVAVSTVGPGRDLPSFGRAARARRRPGPPRRDAPHDHRHADRPGPAAPRLDQSPEGDQAEPERPLLDAGRGGLPDRDGLACGGPAQARRPGNDPSRPSGRPLRRPLRGRNRSSFPLRPEALRRDRSLGGRRTRST